jgi:hypothetical protein
MINLKSIWDNQKPTGEIIVRTKIDEISNLNCFVATNQKTGHHMFIMTLKENVVIPDVKKYRFKGVEIFNVHIENDKTYEVYICLLNKELIHVFSLFIQDILDNINLVNNENEAILNTFNVVSKWKDLFDKINNNGLTLEQQKGLIGELLFLNYLLNNNISPENAIKSWTSMDKDFKAKDFTIGSVGVEVKHSSLNEPKINISNEFQLDTNNFKMLFLVLYSTDSVKEGGFTLNLLVEQTRNKILNYEDKIELNDKLNFIGYFDEDKESYNRMYSLKNCFVYRIEDEFPMFIKNNLPNGIFNVSYSIELSAIKDYIIDLHDILAII